MTEGKRYKLRVFRVPINVPAEVFCDNKSVVINSSVTKYFFVRNITPYNTIGHGRLRQKGLCRWVVLRVNTTNLTLKRRLQFQRRCDRNFLRQYLMRELWFEKIMGRRFPCSWGQLSTSCTIVAGLL